MNRAAGFRLLLICGVGVSLLLVTWLFQGRLQQAISTQAALSADGPDPLILTQLIEGSPDPKAAWIKTWNSAKIVQRQVAMNVFSRVWPNEETLPPGTDTALLAAAMDVDFSVRELALGFLRERNHPELAAAALHQLRDADPHIRCLGLRLLRALPAPTGVSDVVALLDDPDPTVASLSVKLLESWSGSEFGFKLKDTIALTENSAESADSKVARHLLQEGVSRAKTWWAAHQAELAAKPAQMPDRVGTALLRAPDFELPSLDGRKVRLADFRGKVVLLNFWTTWCPACLKDVPLLMELQNRHGKEVGILAVSLDFAPDTHAQDPSVTDTNTHAEDGSSTEPPWPYQSAIRQRREKVQRVAKQRGMNYSILLDEQNAVGPAYNGGELPTLIIIDAEGRIRRRFLGARNMDVMEAMLAEAAKPPAAATSASFK